MYNSYIIEFVCRNISYKLSLFFLVFIFSLIFSVNSSYGADTTTCGCVVPDSQLNCTIPDMPCEKVGVCHNVLVDSTHLEINGNALGASGHFQSCDWVNNGSGIQPDGTTCDGTQDCSGGDPCENDDEDCICDLTFVPDSGGGGHSADYISTEEDCEGLPSVDCSDTDDCTGDAFPKELSEDCVLSDCVDGTCEYTPTNEGGPCLFEGCESDETDTDMGLCSSGACICPDAPVDCADIVETDKNLHQLTAPFDLRNRKTYIQVTNQSLQPSLAIHVQIFQHDKNCNELDFWDVLTPIDTVIYDLDNLVKNDGSKVPVTLDDDSSGYVVITSDLDGSGSSNDFGGPFLVGNFRIIDDAGYEYRANMAGPDLACDFAGSNDAYINYNTVDNAKFADVIGYAYEGKNSATVTNIDNGFTFSIFSFDLDEEPLSCDRRNFACGNVMNYGINEGYKASRGNNLLCPGAFLPDPKGGYVSFENGTNLDGSPPGSDADTNDAFYGWIGLNNNDGTGSMDTWIFGPSEPVIE